MSVAHLSTAEFGVLAGISVKLKLQSLADACAMCELLSRSNSAAYTAQYDDPAEFSTADDIERAALAALTIPDGLLGHFGPCAYNCITNGGALYIGETRTSGDQGEQTANEWKSIEDACLKWQGGERKRLERQADDDLAFAEIPQLPLLAEGDIPPTSQRVIVAEYEVNTSDSQSDYYGSRTVRRVVIGFANGKREDFRQLRRAAATFAPTADYGPDCDEFTAYVIASNSGPRGFNRIDKGERSHWHTDDGHGTEFTTEADAVEFIATREALVSSYVDGGVIDWEWKISRHSLEHRECYSMGHGNWLGRSQYQGWQVSSCDPREAIGMEYFKVAPTPPASRKVASPRVRRAETVEAVERVLPNLADWYAANV